MLQPGEEGGGRAGGMLIGETGTGVRTSPKI